MNFLNLEFLSFSVFHFLSFIIIENEPNSAPSNHIDYLISLSNLAVSDIYYVPDTKKMSSL